MSQQAAPDRVRMLVEAGIALSSELSLDALLQQLVDQCPETRCCVASQLATRAAPRSCLSSISIATALRPRDLWRGEKARSRRAFFIDTRL